MKTITTTLMVTQHFDKIGEAFINFFDKWSFLCPLATLICESVYGREGMYTCGTEKIRSLFQEATYMRITSKVDNSYEFELYGPSGIPDGDRDNLLFKGELSIEEPALIMFMHLYSK